MKKTFSASVWKEEQWYVAHCIEVDVVSQWETEDIALQNLKEAIELHFESPQATILPHIKQIEVNVHAA
ncbi:MAG: type II toxin-antitoxin system HicB family antitoxin [Candidatus Xenobiia bacterium LiM19]